MAEAGATAPAGATAARDVVVRPQPTPRGKAAALIPQRGVDEERVWVRQALSRQYAAMANSVARVLSEHPGFHDALATSSGAVLTDAVSVRMYLSPEGDSVDEALRTGEVGPHVPFARCVVSGLSRLPSHRGATVFRMTPTDGEWDLYRRRKLITDWGFTHSLTAPCAGQDGDVDVLIWSITGRRTKLLEPERDPTLDRVLFAPGTSFKVLDIAEPDGKERGRILLREIAAAEIDNDGRVDRHRISFDELATESLRRRVDSWAKAKPQRRVAPSAARRFQALPGLVTVGGER